MVREPVSADGRQIVADERSGVLYPQRLSRYSAGWISPDPDVSAVVDQYWHVAWALDAHEQLDQRIIDLPAITVTAEDGDVPSPLVVTGVHSGAWRRTIRGSGHVFAIRLRPAGLSVLSDLVPGDLANSTIPLTARFDDCLHGLMRKIAENNQPSERARDADRAIRSIMRERPPTTSGMLANRVLDEIRANTRYPANAELASEVNRSERTIQRALAETLGRGPKWIQRRVRLQEVAQALLSSPTASLASIASDLGYADQSHLTSDFRSVAGITPNAYRREAHRLHVESPRG